LKEKIINSDISNVDNNIEIDEKYDESVNKIVDLI
jgi:hypothetical protein